MGKQLIPLKPEDILAMLDAIIAGDTHNAAEWLMNDPARAEITALRTSLNTAVQRRDAKKAEWREAVQTLREAVDGGKPTILRAVERIRSHWGKDNMRVLDYGIPVSGTPTPSPVPAVPEGITAIGAGAGKIKVNWSTVTRGKFYELWRAEEDPQHAGQLNWALIKTLTKTIFIDTGLLSGRRYFYKVRAGNAAGIGEFSAEANCIAP